MTYLLAMLNSNISVKVSIDTLLIPPLYAIILSVLLDLMEVKSEYDLSRIQFPKAVKYGLVVFAGISLLFTILNQQNLLGGFIYQGF